MVDNHQKPLKPMVAWLQNNRKTIEPNGCPKPFHSIVIVPTKMICYKNSSGPRELRPCDPRDVALAPILQLAELLINNGFQFKERQSNNWIYFAMANRSSLLHFEKASVLHHAKMRKMRKCCNTQRCASLPFPGTQLRPCGLMDKAPDFGSGDCRFESCHGRLLFARNRGFWNWICGVSNECS